MWNAFAEEHAPPALRIGALEFLRGEYGAALDAAKQSPEGAARSLFEAHVLYRMRRRRDALDTLGAARSRVIFDRPADADLARAIEAASLASVGEMERAREALDAVRLPSPHEPRIGGEIAYYGASCAWMLRDYERATKILDAIDARSETNLLARAEVLRGWLYAAKNEYGRQLVSNSKALDLLERETTPDVGVMALALRSSAALARDTANARILPQLERLERQLAWTKWMSLERFQVIRTVAWAHVMQGDYIFAIRELNRAKHLAPNAQSEMLSHLDHAWLAQISGEALHMRAELLEADAAAERVDWEAAADEEVGALLLAAELYAAVDKDAASRYFERAHEARRRLTRWIAFSQDRRLDAFFDSTEAQVRLANGDRLVAIRRAHRAYDVFAEVGYAWRAASIALLLYRMGEDEAWLNPVAAVADVYPRSFLAAELDRLRERGASPVNRLTRRQREIADAIRRGLRTDAIADELHMSPNTVRVHKNKIFKAFGVASEFELLGRLNDWVA
jgi:DNA-binding CsgD family transcriptional regulator